jgi:hypothetical protein
MALPIVYCETNWIVALAFQHDQLHEAAVQLRDEARAGRYEIRLPDAALLEARRRIVSKGNHLSESFARLRDDINLAVKNGYADLTAFSTALQSNAVDLYLQRPVLRILEELGAAGSLGRTGAVRAIGTATGFLETVEELRPRVGFAGKDVVDLYILASVILDRREHRDAPALFLSANRKEFAPRATGVPSDVYAEQRILWWDFRDEQFSLNTALGKWAAKFGG